MRLIKKIKKGTAVILSTALMAGLVPFMPHGVSKVPTYESYNRQNA